MSDLRKAAQQVLETWDNDDWFDADTLRAALAQPEQDLQLVANFLKEYGLEVLDVIAALKTQPEQTAMPQDIAKVLFDNVESLYVEDAQPEPTRSQQMRDAGYTRRPRQLPKEDEQEPVAWLSIDSIGERYLCFSKPDDNDEVHALYTAPPQRKPLTEQEPDPASASEWWTLVMGAAAELENASICLLDEDAKRRAISGAKYYRDAAKALWAAVVRAVEKAHGIGGEA